MKNIATRSRINITFADGTPVPRAYLDWLSPLIEAACRDEELNGSKDD